MSFLRHITPASLGMADTGEKVTFLDTGGYPSDLERARCHFRKGDVLTVKDVDIGDWSSTYRFEGNPDRFNTVMFERVEQSA